MQTVLVVDDSAIDRRLVGDLLGRDSTWSVVYAADGRDALSQLEAHAPDVVVTDLSMPGMNGFELVSALKGRSPRIPVILMTARGSEDIAVQALREGATSYVPKKRLAQDLLRTVQSIMEASRDDWNQSQLQSCMTRQTYCFTFENDPALVLTLPAYLQPMLGHLGICPDKAQRMRVAVALEEALTNSMYHGNLEVESTLRETDDEAYFELIQQRRNQLPYSSRRVHVEASFSATEARFTIRDEGPGFDVSQLPDPTDPTNLERPYGRGVLLMRTFMDEVLYNAAGNEVTLIKRQAK